MFQGWDFWDFFWLLYWAMFLPAWIISAKVFKHLSVADQSYDYEYGEEFFYVTFGFVMAWFWPLFLPAALVYKAVMDD